MNYYYCPTCCVVVPGDAVVAETRIARYGAWGCGVPSCDSCYEDRRVPAFFSIECGHQLQAIDDSDVDPEIFDYVR